MNAELLLAHFNRISDASDAIPRLRKFILDLAVRGKLVAHDAIDDSASTLPSRFRGGGDLRESKNERPSSQPRSSISAEPPSSTPSGWSMTTLGQIAIKITDGAHKTPNYVSTGVPFISVKDFSGGCLRLTNTRFISQEEHALLYKRCDPRRGDILIGRIGTLGKAVVVDTDVEFSLFVSVGLIRFDLNRAAPAYMQMLLNSPLVEREYDRIKVGGGTHTNKLNLGDLHTIAFPLPPIAEQHGIIVKVDELMALCDGWEATQREKEARRDQLTSSTHHHLNNGADAESLRGNAQFFIGHLPRLTTRPDQIKQLRQTILNLAIRGGLNTQHSDDESGSELLKQIAAEKRRLIKNGMIGKQATLKSVDEPDIPFPLPRGWSWSRLGSLVQLVTSGSRDWAKYYSSEGAIFLRMGNLSRDSYHLRLSNIQRVNPPSNGEGSRTKLQEGDILISITGEVGLLGLIPADFGDAYINQHTCLVRPMEQVTGCYLPQVFCSPFGQAQFDEPQRGLKNSFRLSDVTDFLVPLPPLAEQHRIVAKVNELMALCDQLEASLTTAQTEASRLLESVLHHALQDATLA
jgi:type I restriction enzyme, S subunit